MSAVTKSPYLFRLITLNLLSWLLLLVLPGVASGLGGVSTDGTLGGNGYLGQPQVISGVGTDHQVITVPAAAGSLSGTNLFHSFGDFNIGRGQTVVFEDVQKNFVDNVIARVTGGSLSSIDGRLVLHQVAMPIFTFLIPKE